MALKSFKFCLHLYSGLLLAVVVPLVSANTCSGDGSVADTCPEGEYCDSGTCIDCSYCPVDLLMGGGTLTKCLCMENTAKICAMPVPGKQLIEDPMQLSFLNLTGYENVDLSYLKESYNRSQIDCTMPTTTKAPTVSPTTVTTTFMTTKRSTFPTKETPSTTQSGTTETPPAPKNLEFIIIVLAVFGACLFVACIILVVLLCRKNRNRGKNETNVVHTNPGPGDNNTSAPAAASTSEGGDNNTSAPAAASTFEGATLLGKGEQDSAV